MNSQNPGRIGTTPFLTICCSPGSEHVMRLSARNRISGTVTGITRGEATANVTLDAGGIRLVSSITVEAADELGLTEGAQVVAIVKASDVILAVGD
jgi:molybdopterin-binding protein